MTELRVVINGKEYSETQGLHCAECSNKLHLRDSEYGIRYLPISCEREHCDGALGAHPDGIPVGKPADRRAKAARVIAHEEFDRLWKNGKMTRSRAYAWMISALYTKKKKCSYWRVWHN